MMATLDRPATVGDDDANVHYQPVIPGLETLTEPSPEESPAIDMHTPTPTDYVPGTVVAGFLDSGTWSACFGLSYRDLVLHDALVSGRIVREGGRELRAVTGAGGIPSSRNKVAREFLDMTDGEWLWFIDTDMGFQRDTVDRLVASAEAIAAPVMGGLCFAGLRRKPPSTETLYAERFLIQPTCYEWVEVRDDSGALDEAGFRPIVDYKRDAVIEVAATGAACLLIHRSVLANLRAEIGDTWFDPVAIPGAYKGKPRTFSEDMSFCIRVKALGAPIYVDTSVKTTHEKGFIYLDESTFDAQGGAS
jgi:hypothetical protein